MWRVRWFEEQQGGDPEVEQNHAGHAKWYMIAWVIALIGAALVLVAPGDDKVLVYLVVPTPGLLWFLAMAEHEAARQGRHSWGLFVVLAQAWLTLGLALPQALRSLRSLSSAQKSAEARA